MIKTARRFLHGKRRAAFISLDFLLDDIGLDTVDDISDMLIGHPRT